MNGGNTIPLHGIAVFWDRNRQLLRECENIGTPPGRSLLSYLSYAVFGIFQCRLQPFFAANDRHLKPSASNNYRFAADIQGRDPDPLSLDVHLADIFCRCWG